MTNTAHMVTITATAAGDRIYVCEGFSNTPGLAISNCAESRSKAQDWVNTAAMVSLQNLSKFAVQGAVHDLAIIALGINDALVSTPCTPAQYEADLNTLVNAYRSFVGANGVVIVVETPAQTSFVSRAFWEQYCSAAHNVADVLDAPLLDLTHRWGGNYGAAVANGLTLRCWDFAHESPAGYADVARAVFNAIQG